MLFLPFFLHHPTAKFGVYTGFAASQVWEGKRNTPLGKEAVPWQGTKSTNLVQNLPAPDELPPAHWFVLPRGRCGCEECSATHVDMMFDCYRGRPISDSFHFGQIHLYLSFRYDDAEVFYGCLGKGTLLWFEV